MNNPYTLFLILAFSLLFPFQSLKAQCQITAIAYPQVVCEGDNVTLSASGGCGYPNLNLGFTPFPGGFYNNPCGPGPNGSHLWIDTNNDTLRYMATSDLNIYLKGGTIRWYMRYGANQDTGLCNAPDAPNEGVMLQYSTDSGASWNNFPGPNQEPVGNLNNTPPFYTSTPGSGYYWQPYFNPADQQNSTLYYWHEYEVQIPDDAVTPHTRFRFVQLINSGQGHDAWGIDELQIKLPVGNLNIAWEHGPTVLNPPSINLPPKGHTSYDTCFIVHVWDTVHSASDTVCVTVNPIPTARIDYQWIDTNQILFSDNSFLDNPDWAYAYTVWDFGSNATPSTSTDKSVLVTYDSPGSYTAKLSTQAGGCRGFSYFDFWVSTPEISGDADHPIDVFPSPSNGSIHIDIPDEIREQVQLSIFDLSGKKISEQKLPQSGLNKLNLSHLQAGTYIMIFESEAIKQTQKIVIF
ncbi:MAG: T9SS type A sorting domain-containing protein [Bacteroidales bacterium]